LNDEFHAKGKKHQISMWFLKTRARSRFGCKKVGLCL
jgi:hypothetical protein